MPRRLALIALAGALAGPLHAQQTRPERTNWAETSAYADVMTFLDSLRLRGADIQVGELGRSPEGKSIPYVLASRPLVTDPATAHRSGKPVVFIQANIHAGEVEGKEAALMLLRDLTLGALRPLLDSVVLVVVPIYNSDGNDRFAAGDVNRPGQNGPAIVGTRANGQGYDLNRDYIKDEAPETRGADALIAAWDPDVFLDLHTTNGSYHGYLLTWSPGLNPNSPAANDWVRDHLLPDVRARMRARHHQETFPYGNFRDQTPDSLVLGWETYDPRPRFGTNWNGMRGRVSILSEAYSNADLHTRVDVTYNFVREVLSYLVEKRAELRDVIARSDRWHPDSVITRSVLGPGTPQDVIAELTTSAGEGSGMYARRTRTGVFKTIRMPVFDRFVGARREPLAEGYLLPPQHSNIVALLRLQGIIVERLTAGWQGSVEAFKVDSLSAAPFVFEGHRTVSVEGNWGPKSVSVPAGWYFVPTRQRLGVFAAYVLEPESEDGVVTWNFMDRDLRRHGEYPFYRVRDALTVPRMVVP
ncbi:MAG TPA: M14 family metallopeptidase [Gemmatimonadales bacterium]|nr:M14 family metallopeptidase [Gemmatimonadales bacterium]